MSQKTLKFERSRFQSDAEYSLNSSRPTPAAGYGQASGWNPSNEYEFNSYNMYTMSDSDDESLTQDVYIPK